MKDYLERFRRLWGLLVAPGPGPVFEAGAGVEPEFDAGPMRLVEREVGLPVKASVLLSVGWFLFFSLNIEALANTSEVALEAVGVVRQVFVVYAVLNACLAIPIWAMRVVPVKVIQLVVFTVALLDAMFVASLTLVTDGFDSILFWVFPLLIVRNSVSIRGAPLQISLNLLTVFSYLAAGVLDLLILQLDEQTEVLRATEPFLIRVCLLLLLGAICYQLRILVDRDRQRLAEADESAVRQHQMSAAGRLAAEIAHQIKNPLAIINNAAYSLGRSLEGKVEPAAVRQLQMIREEVERSDRIITELIGFAQMAEGRIERLDVVEEMESSIRRVFPSGHAFGTRIEREVNPPIPALFFSRRSLAEILDNLLQNARDVLGGCGTIRVGVKGTAELGVMVTVADDGPGIPRENHERIFEAYFTTRAGGTGLGLAIVKQNLELFGGRVEVESEVGRGTCFRLYFPGRYSLRANV